MDEMPADNTRPIDSFSKVHWALQYIGYYKLLKPRNKITEAAHRFYRQLVIFCFNLYLIQHMIYIFQIWDDKEKLLGAFILLIPEVFLLLKVSSLYFGTKKIDEILKVLNDPIFAAQTEMDKKLLRDNAISMQKIWKIAMIGLTVIVYFWISGPIIQRFKDETTKIPTYVPFEQDTWPKFLLALGLDSYGVILWIAYGHISTDCLIATYFAQARVQLKIIKYNLEHLFDASHGLSRNFRNFQFVDDLDETVQQRFVFYVKRYNKVIWYTKEITSILNVALSVEFFGTVVTMCLAVYQTSSLTFFSPEFMFCVGYYVANQFQIFLFCFFGGMVEHESKFISDSVYLGKWLSASPKFRKQLVIAMLRWNRPITPRVAGIIPLSLSTFTTITRSAYTLYTVLKTRNSSGDGSKSLAF